MAAHCPRRRSALAQGDGSAPARTRNSYAGPGLVRGVIAPLAPPPERNMGPLARTPLSAVDMGAACVTGAAGSALDGAGERGGGA